MCKSTVSGSKAFTLHTVTRPTSTKHLAVVLAICPNQFDVSRVQVWSYGIAKIFSTVMIVVVARSGLWPVRVIEAVAVPSRLHLTRAFPVWTRVKSVRSWPTCTLSFKLRTFTCTFIYMYMYMYGIRVRDYIISIRVYGIKVYVHISFDGQKY